jgi:hypothetical protein
MFSALFIYFINPSAANFPGLLFQTRYRTNCFARQAGRVWFAQSFRVQQFFTGYSSIGFDALY